MRPGVAAALFGMVPNTCPYAAAWEKGLRIAASFAAADSNGKAVKHWSPYA
jgi:hypothetical protein